jgi:hypothetical protein
MFGPNTEDVSNVGHSVNIQLIICLLTGHLVLCDSEM